MVKGQLNKTHQLTIIPQKDDLSISRPHFFKKNHRLFEMKPTVTLATAGVSDNSDNTDSEEILRKRQIRLRRCPSTSKVESIVTEEEKQRRAQPDKP